MTNYDRGRAFEHATRHHLQADGYWVMRAAGSKTKVDLIAIKPGQLLLIQCKRDGKLPPAERHELIHLASLIAGALPILAAKRDRQATPDLHEFTGPGPHDRRPFITDEVANLVPSSPTSSHLVPDDPGRTSSPRPHPFRGTRDGTTHPTHQTNPRPTFSGDEPRSTSRQEQNHA